MTPICRYKSAAVLRLLLQINAFESGDHIGNLTNLKLQMFFNFVLKEFSFFVFMFHTCFIDVYDAQANGDLLIDAVGEVKSPEPQAASVLDPLRGQNFFINKITSNKYCSLNIFQFYFSISFKMMQF